VGLGELLLRAGIQIIALRDERVIRKDRGSRSQQGFGEREFHSPAP
jgi:hypothetical protein